VNGSAAGELAARHGLSIADFLALWTQAEVAAKLLGRPSLLAFRERLADNPMLTIRTGALQDLIVSVGWTHAAGTELSRPEEGPVPPVGDHIQEPRTDDATAVHGILVSEEDRSRMLSVRAAELVEHGAERRFTERIEEKQEEWFIGKRKVRGIAFDYLPVDAPTGDVGPSEYRQFRVQLDADHSREADFPGEDQ